jgi:hypothetical protein
MATDRFTKSPASRKRMSELISRIGKDESQDAGDLLTDEALEDLPELAKPRGSQTSKSREMALADEPTIQEVPEGVEYRTEDSAGGAARPLGEIGGYGRVDEEAFSKMLDEAEPFSFEDEKKLVAQQVAAPESFGTWEGGGGYTYTHVADAPGGPYIRVEKEGKSSRRVVPGTKGIGGSDMYGRILAEKTLLDVSPEQAKAFYKSLPPDQREAIEAAGNVDVPAEDGEKADDAGEIPVDLRRPDTFYAEGDAGEIPVDLRRPPEPAEGESAPKTSEAGEPLPKPAESQKAAAVPPIPKDTEGQVKWAQTVLSDAVRTPMVGAGEAVDAAYGILKRQGRSLPAGHLPFEGDLDDAYRFYKSERSERIPENQGSAKMVSESLERAADTMESEFGLPTGSKALDVYRAGTEGKEAPPAGTDTAPVAKAEPAPPRPGELDAPIEGEQAVRSETRREDYDQVAEKLGEYVVEKAGSRYGKPADALTQDELSMLIAAYVRGPMRGSTEQADAAGDLVNSGREYDVMFSDLLSLLYDLPGSQEDRMVDEALKLGGM